LQTRGDHKKVRHFRSRASRDQVGSDSKALRVAS